MKILKELYPPNGLKVEQFLAMQSAGPDEWSKFTALLLDKKLGTSVYIWFDKTEPSRYSLTLRP